MKCVVFVCQTYTQVEIIHKNIFIQPLQRRLVARYLSQLEDEAEAETLTNEDLEQTKQDLIKEMVRVISGAGRKFSRLDSVRC